MTDFVCRLNRMLVLHKEYMRPKVGEYSVR